MILSHPNGCVKTTRLNKPLLKARWVLTELKRASNREGRFELNVPIIAKKLQYSCATIYKRINDLKRWGEIELVQQRTGRGNHSLYKISNWKPSTLINPKDVKTKTPINARARIGVSNQKADPPSRHEIDALLRKLGELVKFGRLGSARRLAMKAIRWNAWRNGLNHEQQRLICSALGKKLWAKSLADLVAFTCEALNEMERGRWAETLGKCMRRKFKTRWGLVALLARCITPSGALIDPPMETHRANRLQRRVQGLSAWLEERVAEFKAKTVCAACGVSHSVRAFEEGVEANGKLSCFGWARMKIGELEETLWEIKKQTEARELEVRWAEVHGAL